MSHHLNRAERLDHLVDRLRSTENATADLLSSVGRECERILAARHSSRVAQITTLIAAGAWTDAALTLIDAELPFWKLRRVAYDDGRWYCAISRQRELPEWLDQAVEADHQNLSLAILSVFVGALQKSSASKTSSVPAVRATEERYDAVGCDNFA